MRWGIFDICQYHTLVCISLVWCVHSALLQILYTIPVFTSLTRMGITDIINCDVIWFLSSSPLYLKPIFLAISLQKSFHSGHIQRIACFISNLSLILKVLLWMIHLHIIFAIVCFCLRLHDSNNRHAGWSHVKRRFYPTRANCQVSDVQRIMCNLDIEMSLKWILRCSTTHLNCLELVYRFVNLLFVHHVYVWMCKCVYLAFKMYFFFFL